MKHLTKLFLLGTVVLATAACQRLSEEGLNNPNYNPDTQEVVTNFVFNIATQPQTKQSAGAVQAGESNPFRGMVDARLLAYNCNPYYGILPADADANKIYNLSQLATASQISWTENRRVLELSLPLQTNTLLFYGRAPIGNTYDGYTNAYDCYGHMDSYDIDLTSGSASFNVGHRLAASEYQKFLIVENLFAGIQSSLLNHHVDGGTEIDADDAPNGVTNTYRFDVTVPNEIKWKGYAKEDGTSPYTGEARTALENKLGYLYKQLTNIHAADGELRAGSGEATTRMAQDLLTVLNEIRCAIPNDTTETLAKYFANEVYTRVLKYFSGTTNNTGAPITDVTFNSQATIVSNYLSSAEMQFRPSIPTSISDAPSLFWPTEAQLATISGAAYQPKDFPFNFNLPRGATHIAFDTEHEIFYYPQEFNVSGMTGLPGVGDTYNALSYFYPAELLYFGNSPIRTTSSDKSFSDYPKGSGIGGEGTELKPYQWCNDNAWGAEWNDTKVVASTRGVAMKYNINYGVAVLKTQVKYDDTITAINDNNHNVQVELYGESANNEQDNSIDIVDNMFALTGIIIGGQPQAIGWDHLPVKVQTGTDEVTGDPIMEYKYGFIYDKAIPADSQGIPADGKSVANYTLVYDNFHAASQSGAGIYTPEAVQDRVSVALEFRNDTGKDIYGNHNVIRDGGYFYLIGLLDMGDATNSITWPDEKAYTTHIVPPYTAAGGSQHQPRIFIQDYMTTVTFTIGENSLHYAYLTVPDLRSASMTLGLSVNLSWETGLDFEEVILGGN